MLTTYGVLAILLPHLDFFVDGETEAVLYLTLVVAWKVALLLAWRIDRSQCKAQS